MLRISSHFLVLTLLNIYHIISERNKIIEDKQRRLDKVEKALSELRTVCIMWANPASDVLVVGSFDGWTSQVSAYSNLYCKTEKLLFVVVVVVVLSILLSLF
jgi:hypothetical protein